MAENAGLVGSVGPRAVASTVLARLARLEPEARAVARALSVLADGAALPVVAALAGLDESTVAAATGALVRAEIVRPEPPLGFVHPLVRDAVYRELPPGERELQHERAAQLLAEAGAPAEQVAAQLLAAPRRGAAWAVDQLEAAAVAAVARAAPESAVAYGRRALEEPPPPERRFPVLLALAGAEAFTDAPAAAGRLRDAYDAAPDPAARAAIAIPLVHTLLFTDRPAEGVAVAREAAAVAGTDDERMELEALELAGAYFGAEVPDLDGRLAAHRAPPPPGDLGRASLAAIASVHWALTDGRAGACAELALAALRGGDLFASDRGPLSFGATIVLGLADREEAPELLEDALDRSRSRGALFSVGAAYTWLGFAAWRRGDLAGAAAHLEQSRELTAAYGVGEGASMAPLALTVEVALARGDTVLARTLLGQGRDRADRADATRWWRGAEAHVLLAEGRWAEALAMARATGERYPEIGNPVANPWRGDAADALAVLGDATAALELAEAQLALARHWGAPGALGAALRRIGRLTGDADALEEAVAVLDGSPARLELARALAAYGTALRVTERRPADAREPLHRALALAAACDAPALAEHARTELYAAGARPRTDAAGGAAALTASERRVAGMAAEGRIEPRHRAGAVRHPQDRRGPPLQRLPQAGHPLPARAAGRVGDGRVTLIEREAEVAALDAALAETVAGSGRLLVIGGPAGIGKSGLLADLRARAGDELLVLAARASELEREFGFGVVRQLFEATAADPARGPAALAGAAAPAASVLGAMDDAGVASFAALHGLFWLASNLAAEQPLLLAVDDLHWCDRPSLRFLAYLARRLEGLPILLATTVRSGDPGTDPTLLAEIALDPAAQALEPGPLSATGAAALVRERLGAAAEPAFCEACHAATGGNPLLLRQLLRALEAERVEPVAAQRGGRARGRAARRVEHRARAARPAAGRRRRGRARRQRARRARRAARRRRAGGARGAGRGGRDRRAGPRGDPAARPAARLRPPARARRGLPRAAARRARAAPRARGAAAARRGRAVRAGRRAAAGGAAPRRGLGRRRARGRGGDRDAARGGRQRRRATCAGRWRSRLRPTVARRCSLGAGHRGGADERPRGRRPPPRGVRAPRRPGRARPRGRWAGAGADLHRPRARGGRAGPRGAGGAPARRGALAETLEALEIATYYVGGRHRAVDGLVRVAPAPRAGRTGEAARPAPRSTGPTAAATRTRAARSRSRRSSAAG